MVAMFVRLWGLSASLRRRLGCPWASSPLAWAACGVVFRISMFGLNPRSSRGGRRGPAHNVPGPTLCATQFRIWRLALPILAFAILGRGAQARVRQAPDLHCEEAIGAAARASHVPNQLLAAIGLVETGRQDPASGAWRPWPWAINAEGKGLFFDSKSQAIAAVRSLQGDGVRSIDVGCMQVNLLHHPDAFATLEEAFDPKRNAIYAGYFLSQLFRRTGDWMIAAGWYHSTTANLAAEYAKRVAAILPAGKQSIVAARGAFRSMIVKDATPVVGRGGVIWPTVGLTSSGLVAAHPADRFANAKGKGNVGFGG
jgi:hypothetical protein